MSPIRAMVFVLTLAAIPAQADQTTRITIPRLPDPGVAPPEAFSDKYRPPGILGRDLLGRDRTRPLKPTLPRISGGCRGVTRNAADGGPGILRQPDCAGERGAAAPPTAGGEPSGCARFGETLICP